MPETRRSRATDTPPIRVLIVENHLLVRTGLKQVLKEEYREVVFGDARTAAEAVAQVGKRPWDLVILDIGLPDHDGFYVLHKILQQRPGTRILILTIHADRLYATRARELGAAGYLCKDAGRSDLVKALRKVLNGKTHFDHSLPPDSSPPVTPPPARLSAREYKVLVALAAGKQSGEIAAELQVSVKTISTFRRRILDKLHLSSTADLVHYVIDHGLS